MKEHEIVLTPALTVSGTVPDERTGAPIPRFRIITGWPSPDRASGTMGATWSSIDRFWLSFEGGQFQHLYEELVRGGLKEPAFLFKFEADGYAPLVTRTVLADVGVYCLTTGQDGKVWRHPAPRSFSNGQRSN